MNEPASLDVWMKVPLTADNSATVWIPSGYKMTAHDVENLQILLTALHDVVARNDALRATSSSGKPSVVPLPSSGKEEETP